MYKHIAWDYCDYVSNSQRKKIIAWAKRELDSDFIFHLVTMLIHYHGSIDNKTIDTLKPFLWNRIKGAEKTTDSGEKHYPEDNPFEELELVGLWCFYGQISKALFAEFLGHSALFDFLYEYNSFDFHRFDVSWLLNRFTRPILERISKDAFVREKTREAIAARISTEKIDKLDKQDLQNILIDYFC